jgi:hypothetical protein
LERHLVWNCYETLDREKSRDWFHPPFIGEGMVCNGYKSLNCTVLACCLNSGLIWDTSLDLVNVAKIWKMSQCVFLGVGGFYTLFHHITYLSTPTIWGLLMKSVGSPGSLPWLFSMKVIVRHFLINSHNVWLHSLSCYLRILRVLSAIS